MNKIYLVFDLKVKKNTIFKLSMDCWNWSYKHLSMLTGGVGYLNYLPLIPTLGTFDCWTPLK